MTPRKGLRPDSHHAGPAGEDKAQQMTLGGLFDGNYSHEVPHYQRPYEWPDHLQWKLCSDLYQAWLDDEPYRFLGTIIVNHDLYNDRYEVVDGQQRLVTLLVLLRAIIYWTRAHEEQDEDAQRLTQFIRTGQLFQRDSLEDKFRAKFAFFDEQAKFFFLSTS